MEEGHKTLDDNQIYVRQCYLLFFGCNSLVVMKGKALLHPRPQASPSVHVAQGFNINAFPYMFCWRIFNLIFICEVAYELVDICLLEVSF
jgi:hypothetical protein